ncbi:hypothetical protein [Salinicoccus sesuvii]|uniref:hypothetical protein n=1 Tax=Salinicoccus sesuvii TaxID=868281 RepID=UPI003617DA0C
MPTESRDYWEPMHACIMNGPDSNAHVCHTLRDVKLERNAFNMRWHRGDIVLHRL